MTDSLGLSLTLSLKPELCKSYAAYPFLLTFFDACVMLHNLCSITIVSDDLLLDACIQDSVSQYIYDWERLHK